MSTHDADPWSSLRAHTAARIALGRAGSSLPTAQLLDFALAHAAARDAVHSVLDVTPIEKSLDELNLKSLRLTTAAADRPEFLKRPDLGRRLSDHSAEVLAHSNSACDIAFIIADGLSAPAAQKHAIPVLTLLAPLLKESQLVIGPVAIVTQARVAVQDQIGFLLGAKLSIILIGERPGLGTADSLGAYLVYDPRPGRTDAERNCVSNIRDGGLSPSAAANTLFYLVVESLRRKLSGVGIKDDRPLAEPNGSKSLDDLRM